MQLWTVKSGQVLKCSRDVLTCKQIGFRDWDSICINLTIPDKTKERGSTIPAVEWLDYQNTRRMLWCCETPILSVLTSESLFTAGTHYSNRATAQPPSPSAARGRLGLIFDAPGKLCTSRYKSFWKLVERRSDNFCYHLNRALHINSLWDNCEGGNLTRSVGCFLQWVLSNEFSVITQLLVAVTSYMKCSTIYWLFWCFYSYSLFLHTTK